MIMEVLKDEEYVSYLNNHGMKSVTFDQYPKGCNKLGGLVEVCVKMVKRLLFGAIGRKVLTYSEFEFTVSECIHIVNKRPIGILEPLRDSNTQETLPITLTPELIIHGYELISPNILPQENDEWSPDVSHQIYLKICTISGNLYITLMSNNFGINS